MFSNSEKIRPLQISQSKVVGKFLTSNHKEIKEFKEEVASWKKIIYLPRKL